VVFHTTLAYTNYDVVVEDWRVGDPQVQAGAEDWRDGDLQVQAGAEDWRDGDPQVQAGAEDWRDGNPLLQAGAEARFCLFLFLFASPVSSSSINNGANERVDNSCLF
jgi:hypothetical protein